MRCALPFLSALLLWLSFPPVDWGFLGWVALVPLIVYALTEPKRWRAFLIGWAAGFAFHTAAFWWVGHTSPVLGPLGLGLYKGLYWAAFVLLVRWASRAQGDRECAPVAVAAPVAWVVLELTRAYLFGGLPFWIVGYTTHAFPLFIQIADLGGVWFVTFVVVLVNATIARAFVMREADREYRWSAGASIAAITLSLAYGAVRLGTIELADGIRIGIVQPNIPQDLKEIAKGRDFEGRLRIFQKHMELTRQAARGKPDLIVWPEVALLDELIFQDGRWLENAYFKRAQAPALETGAHAVVGSIVWEPPPGVDPYTREAIDRSTWTNSAVYLDPKGRVVGRFDKIRLVPFSEHFDVLGGLINVERLVARFLNLSKLYAFRPGTELPVFDHPRGRFAVSICSENYYPEISREFARKGARTIVNISNDGWFRESAELDAQLAMAKFRAIENRVHYVRATNTGISAMIEPTGRVAEVIVGPDGNRKSVAGTLVAVARVTESGSLYRALGDWAAWLCVGLAAGGIVALRLARRRQNVDTSSTQP